MTCETDAARVWAALLGMALIIAIAVTFGYWLTIYHRDARELQSVLGEDYTTIDMIWDDLPSVSLR